jgi:hypothetical protein
MAAAKYTVHVPAADEFGQPLKLHRAVHKHMNDIGFQGATMHEGDPHHAVTGWAEDCPEMDSTAKQIGAYTGEIANVPHIFVTKEGDKSANWPVVNPHYEQGYPAEQGALDEPNISEIGLQHPDMGDTHPLSTGLRNPIFGSVHEQLIRRYLRSGS